MFSDLKRLAQLALLVSAIFAVASSRAPAAEPTAADRQNATTLSNSSAPAAASATATPKDATAKSESKSRTWQVIFVVEKNSAKCDEALKRLNAPGGDFESMKKVGWHIGADKDSDVRIVDREEIPELVAQLNVREYPAVGCVEKGELVRSFKSGCTTPLDCWTLCWLATGVNQRPAGTVSEAAKVETTGHYPLRGNHWSVDGDFSPAREAVLEHLRGPNHAWEVPLVVAANSHIEQWSYEELRSLHDDLHEKYGPPSATDAPAAADTSGVQSARAKYKGG